MAIGALRRRFTMQRVNINMNIMAIKKLARLRPANLLVLIGGTMELVQGSDAGCWQVTSYCLRKESMIDELQ